MKKVLFTILVGSLFLVGCNQQKEINIGNGKTDRQVEKESQLIENAIEVFGSEYVDMITSNSKKDNIKIWNEKKCEAYMGYVDEGYEGLINFSNYTKKQFSRCSLLRELNK